MDRFHSIQVFVNVADCDGFAAAARRLNMSPPAVTRAVSMLEDQLGTRLFVRTTRTVRLTDSGKRFLEDAKRILLDLEEAENAAVGLHANPRGELCVTASALFGRMFVTPILSEFLDQHLQLTARTLYVDRVVNLMDEGLDVGIRIGNLPDSSLIALRCGSVSQVMFASPEYLNEHGIPENPEDLMKHMLIQSSAISASNEWVFQDKGKAHSVMINPRIRMNTNDAAIEMALRGGGISRLLSYQIAPYIAEGRLLPILAPFQLPPVPIHLVHHEGRLVSAKVRSFVDFAVRRFRADPHLY
jgi:DNA-binding transcriptional LysR family regulator